MASLLALAGLFLRLSFLAIGGGIGVIPEMVRQVVTVHGWLTPREFVDGYALSQVTPGPGMLVVAFVGYRVAGLLGAVVAVTAMFGPASLLTWVVAHSWERLRGRPWPEAVARALAPLAIGLMAAGVYTVGRSALTDAPTMALAGVTALVLGRRWASPVLVILLAGLAGWLMG